MADKATIVSRIADRISGAVSGTVLGRKEMLKALELANDAVFMAQEGVIDLELAQSEAGWVDMAYGQSDWNITHKKVLDLTKMSRMMYLMNPLIRRAVTVQELYVWGSGYTLKAESESVQEVIEDFFNDPKNQSVVGDAFDIREREQRIDGNTFLVFFQNQANGSARVRKIPVDQIIEIISDPEDSCDIWYYKRAIYSGSGTTYELYPDIGYTPRARPGVYNTFKVNWGQPVLHIKTGALSDMKYGLPELWSAMPWATAYKKILENFSTILAAYARLAMKVSGTGGKAGIAAAKSQLNTQISTTNVVDKNPPTNTGSWFLAAGGMDVAPIKTANSTTGPDEARALRSMVASGSDTPEHFFGDSDIGNFATSTTLDRPTELKMVSRQNMWRKIILQICLKLIEWSALARNGKLRNAGFTAKTMRDAFDPDCNTVVVTPPSEEDMDVSVIFPTILSRDVIDRVRAVVMAATLNGSSAEGIIPDRKQLYELLMTALDEEDVQDLVAKYYPEEVKQGFVDPAQQFELDKTTAQAALVAAKTQPKPAAPAAKK